MYVKSLSVFRAAVIIAVMHVICSAIIHAAPPCMHAYMLDLYIAIYKNSNAPFMQVTKVPYQWARAVFKLTFF